MGLVVVYWEWECEWDVIVWMGGWRGRWWMEEGDRRGRGGGSKGNGRERGISVPFFVTPYGSGNDSGLSDVFVWYI